MPLAPTGTAVVKQTAGAAVTVVDTLLSTVAGELVIVWNATVRGTNVPDNLITDDKGNTWSQLGFKFQDPVSVSISWAIIASGKDGNLAITLRGNGTNSYDMGFRAERWTGGPASSPVSGTAVTAGAATGTQADTGAFTPADANALYVSMCCFSSGSNITHNQAPGDTNWTDPGQLNSALLAGPLYYILSGAAVARRAASSTDGSSNPWATMLGAFKPAAAGGGPTVQAVPTMRTPNIFIT